MINKPICRVCGIELDDENWTTLLKKGNRRICKVCNREKARAWIELNPTKAKDSRARWRIANLDKMRTYSINHRRKVGIQSYTKNKSCSVYLGVHIAERVLGHVFKDVTRMPINNPGYDFVCNRGKLIDVKSSCQRNDLGWDFRIKRNTTADYFLCLAFDNRESLTPLHTWLLPGIKFSSFVGVSIRPSTIHKWDAYKLDIESITTCCNTIRGV